jgi:hypothetical protein
MTWGASERMRIEVMASDNLRDIGFCTSDSSGEFISTAVRHSKNSKPALGSVAPTFRKERERWGTLVWVVSLFANQRQLRGT